ncbi:Aste57867_12294 [Aphanomyces stellatus]|uniref:Aste57867_12294 protein n=1 Tax=Aphanomyces stellatus TaxID=120398 RepID=A0A485KV64_9STRA|nr:hypothetical protein As57867_012249 [Aphanomyces stellatus]VFT89147.1 Aste57867_12294 [Aphanomyces stellatus]
MTHIFFYNNDYLQRLENITFETSILNLDLSYLKITNWIMDNKTFIALNTTLKTNTTAANSEATNGKFDSGYNYYGLTITSDPTEGNLKMWPKHIIFNVCVLKDPVVIEKGAGLSTGAIIGIAVGGADCAAKELEEVREQFNLTHTPTLSNGEEAGINMQALTLSRLDEGDLKLQKKLGSGAFADVWLATFQNQQVAVKQLHNNHVTMNQLQSFVEEIQLMASFNSPYIVKLIGAAWTRPSDVKCVMELMDGGDLKDYVVVV